MVLHYYSNLQINGSTLKILQMSKLRFIEVNLLNTQQGKNIGNARTNQVFLIFETAFLSVNETACYRL